MFIAPDIPVLSLRRSDMFRINIALLWSADAFRVYGYKHRAPTERKLIRISMPRADRLSSLDARAGSTQRMQPPTNRAKPN